MCVFVHDNFFFLALILEKLNYFQKVELDAEQRNMLNFIERRNLRLFYLV